MDIDKEVEAFRANLETLEFTGTTEVAWVAVDKNRDVLSQLNSIRMATLLYPDLFIFSCEASSEEELLFEMENHIKEAKSKISLKSAKQSAEELGLKVGI